MLCFPQLSTGAVGQYPIAKRRVSRTVVNGAADGAEVKLPDAAAGEVEWELAFATLSDAERAALTELHGVAEGRLGAFTFLDPTDNLLCWSEQLDQPVWERNLLLTVTAGVSDPNGGTRATRVSNTGAGALAIRQVVNGPGWYQFAFGMLARSDQPQQITLVRSTASQTHSVAFSVGPEWKRILLSGQFGGTEEVVSFAVQLGAGHWVDLYGIQAEAQVGLSGYKATLSRCGVYPLARFMSDELSMTAEGPGQHSCRIGVRARA
jgi:hypothetical protein